MIAITKRRFIHYSNEYEDETMKFPSALRIWKDTEDVYVLLVEGKSGKPWPIILRASNGDRVTDNDGTVWHDLDAFTQYMAIVNYNKSMTELLDKL